MRRTWCATATLTVLLAAVCAAAPGVQDAKADKGAKVFADQKCSLCHAVGGKGNPKGPLDDVGSKLTADEIRQWIVDPGTMTVKAKADRKPPMPTKYASLPKDDIDALVAYLSAQKKK